MYAERVMLETDALGRLKQIPSLPANTRLEAIFLVIPESEQANYCRQPHKDIAGKTIILGNIIDAAPESEWNLPR